VDEVDVFIGTGGPGYRVGSATPAATTPFGMVKLGPDTMAENSAVSALHCSGYYHDDTYIQGFSHLHMHGVGVADQGDVLVMPADGFDATWRDERDWRRAFSHDDERASPGRYEVKLADGIRAELTATPHAGLHRYTFPADTDPVLIFDLEHVLGGRNVGAEITIDAEAGVVSGYMTNSGSFSGGSSAYPVYFYARVEGGIDDFGTWDDAGHEAGRAAAAGIDLGAWIAVAPEMSMAVGVSLVDVAAAAANLSAEIPEGRSFGEVADAARQAWIDALATFHVEGGDADGRTIFWTSVYHLLQMPTQYSDHDGRYVGFDRQVHEEGDHTWHSDLSMWDTYRTAHPAYALFYPDKNADFAQSLVRMREQGGAFPRWPIASWEGGSMLGDPASIVLADAVVKGNTDWDVDAAWPLLRAQAMGEGSTPYNARPDIATIERLRYYPSDVVGASVAWTLENAWADWSLAQYAEAIGQHADAAHFAWRALGYNQVFDPAVGFFHARRSDGTFDPEFDEHGWADEYTEGNAWQYLWLAPWDPDGLAELLGGPETARARLEQFFQEAVTEGLVATPPFGYWHGNEPDIHAAYLFAPWGDHDATARWVRWIEDERYFADPDGLNGNDDAGTLSAWYIFSALGFFPIAGTTEYILGIPRFPYARFRLGDGWFTVSATGEGPSVSEVTLDGVAIEGPTLRHDRLVPGGHLAFTLGP
jgi:predicted alpha-1,2-mannosidase